MYSCHCCHSAFTNLHYMIVDMHLWLQGGDTLIYPVLRSSSRSKCWPAKYLHWLLTRSIILRWPFDQAATVYHFDSGVDLLTRQLLLITLTQALTFWPGSYCWSLWLRILNALNCYCCLSAAVRRNNSPFQTGTSIAAGWVMLLDHWCHRWYTGEYASVSLYYNVLWL